MTPDRVAVLDWSAAGRPVRGANSIWLGVAGPDGVATANIATRAAAAAQLHALVTEALTAGERLLIGVDFAFGFPAGFARALTGRDGALAVWDWLAARVTDSDDNRSNYRAVAAGINARLGPGAPFWGNGARADIPGLPRRKPALPAGLAPHRATDLAARAVTERSGTTRPKPVWQLAGAGAVGAQTLTGLPRLQALRAAFPGRIAVWPFDPIDTAPVVLAEVYPSLLAAEVRATLADDPAMVADAAQVRLLSTALLSLGRSGGLAALLTPDAPSATLAEEGWILGAGRALDLRRALPAVQTPPRLRDDCFAMPQGVAWMPVDAALDRLRAALRQVTGTEEGLPAAADGRFLARDAVARRSNPPAPNAAVDGWGMAHAATGAGVQRLPLVPGRAAAGQPYDGRVPEGAAVRILTGAILPDGVDTVVMEEDCAVDGAAITFDGPLRAGANTRRAGEDVAAGTVALPAGHRIGPPDIALLSALGIGRVAVHRRLRVAVLSTGDEIVDDPATPAPPHRIFDANRPMLLSLARRWGFEAVDLGHVRDDAAAIAARLDRGAGAADAILTSGGASAGDEDHVARLLRDRGNLSVWRVAMKPGRPLALALWRGVPVFGLPGNPVAAFICALVFGWPALTLMAGGGWPTPMALDLPAGFAKTKKAGRREFLRARVAADGRVEVFGSEGSGRISGLSWARGLVELPDRALVVAPGDRVRFLPFSGFGLG